MISIKQLAKQFGKLQVLKDFSLELERGKSYALMGPNGSGKTTLIKIILGMCIPNKGDVFVNGEAIKAHYQYRSKIGYMPQIGRYPGNIRIGQLILMMQDVRKNKIRDCDEELIDSFGLRAQLGKSMHTLSGGTRQKVSAALAFMFQPDVLILDEPTAGLDPIAVEILKNKILKEKEKGKLILITSHILSDLEELTDHAIYIHEGNVFFNDTIAELKERTGEKKFSPAIARIMEWSMDKSKEKQHA